MEMMDLGRTIAALSIVLLLIAVIAFIAKRFLPNLQASGKFPARRLQLVEAFAIDPRNRVAILRVDGQELLIGIGPNGPVRLDGPLQPANAEPAANKPPQAEKAAGL